MISADGKTGFRFNNGFQEVEALLLSLCNYCYD